MCFHYSLTQKAKALKARFNIEELDDEELAEYLHFHANGLHILKCTSLPMTSLTVCSFLHGASFPAGIKTRHLQKKYGIPP